MSLMFVRRRPVLDAMRRVASPLSVKVELDTP
jgi:hypothetical protein